VVGRPEEISPETAVHRIGGGRPDNLHLKPPERSLQPPGISVLLAGTPPAAAEQLRQAFPDPLQYPLLHAEAARVGSTTAGEVRGAGFEIVPVPTRKLPNHARIIHADGVAGFDEANLQRLSAVFRDTPTPRS
jgi:hypothetical protein